MSVLLKFATAIGALTMLAMPAHASRCEGSSWDTVASVPCSATWRLEAECQGLDMWAAWRITGRTVMPDSFIRPWLDYPIQIIGYDLLKLRDLSMLAWMRSWFSSKAWYAWLRSFARSTDSWFMVGSTLQPDAMVVMGHNETHTSLLWPAGAGQPWPSKADARPVAPTYTNGILSGAAGDLIDLHGSCTGGTVTVLLTVYYTSK